MPKDLLLEIGMEEVPARFVRGAVEQLEQKMIKWLMESRIEYGSVKASATPRRIAVSVSAVAERQKDLKEEVKGPSRKIALDEGGSWSKAALGFARSQGVDEGSLYFQELGGVEYVYASKQNVGLNTDSLLGTAFSQLIASMSFPKNMRWSHYDLKFVRPIRWIVALFGQDVIPIQIASVHAGNITRGHRFLGGSAVIESPQHYLDQLRSQFVYADIDERKQLIERQINELAAERDWVIPIQEDLLEEVLFLVEFPTVLFGTFDPEFLHIPQQVLITSMREHQRYFPVLDHQGKLLPYFVTVRNGNAVSLDQVARGNEKVLRARLSDARFFYQEDQKQRIESLLTRLETVVFQEELGSIGDKVRRVSRIADQLSDIAGSSAEEKKFINRAAAICKFDLVTLMVYEFPELQGVMGEDYARKAGEHEQVARAINEHYMPRFSGDQSPASRIGAIISIADKIDTIVGCFSIGILPTGSQDPYALRRQAAGIVQILMDNRIDCTLSELFSIALAVYDEAKLQKRSREDLMKDLFDFFSLRVKNVMSESLRYDVIDAVMGAGFNHVASAVRRGTAIASHQNSEHWKAIVESFNRVNNLAPKADIRLKIDPSLFIDPVETELYDCMNKIHNVFLQQLLEQQELEALETLSQLREPITRFFDTVMIMADDLDVRNNRLNLLGTISNNLKRFADFQKLVY